MSQGVTYADLRFVRSPPEAKKRSPPAEPAAEEEEGGGAELTYENVRGGGPPPPRQDPQEQEEAAAAARGGSICAAGVGSWTWPLALLAAGLFLLAGAIGLGIRYWQVSRQLQQASEGHSAEWEALAESISSKEGQLDEARAELGSTRLTLQECWTALQDCRTAGNSTQARLQGLERELRLTKDQLAVLQEEKTQTEEELHRARSCQQRGCCPLGWELFRWKCLWVSSDWKTWEQSKKDCERKASHLVILKRPLEAAEVWDALPQKGTESSLLSYGAWIGLQEKRAQALFWVDGSPYEGTETPSYYNNGYCVKINNWSLSFDNCGRSRPYICEKAASPAWTALAPGQ